MIGFGFDHPTPIQHQVIPKALEGLDIVGLAQTGSGKTGAFGLPMAERLIHGKGVRGLIMCPTREIALQTQSFLEVVGQGPRARNGLPDRRRQDGPADTGLRNHPDIIVATPGRLLGSLSSVRTLRLDKIEQLVLDEADHMLDLGFLPQIQRFSRRSPPIGRP